MPPRTAGSSRLTWRAREPGRHRSRPQTDHLMRRARRGYRAGCRLALGSGHRSRHPCLRSVVSCCGPDRGPPPPYAQACDQRGERSESPRHWTSWSRRRRVRTARAPPPSGPDSPAVERSARRDSNVLARQEQRPGNIGHCVVPGQAWLPLRTTERASFEYLRGSVMASRRPDGDHGPGGSMLGGTRGPF